MTSVEPCGGAVQVDPGRAEGVDDDPDQRGRGGDGHGEGGPAVAGVGVRGAADGRPGEHQPEEQEDDDGADVDQDLHPGDELGGEQQVLDGEPAERHHQPQRGVHQLLGGDGDDGGAEGDEADEEEGDLDAGRGEEAVAAWRPAAAVLTRRPPLVPSARPSAAAACRCRCLRLRPRQLLGGLAGGGDLLRLLGAPGRARAARAPSTSTRGACPARG